MSVIVHAVKPDDIKGFIGRSGYTVTLRSASDAWAGFLKADGGSGLNLPELEFTWLGSKGAVGNNLHDRWGNYLNTNGYAGNFMDQLRVLFSSGSSGFAANTVAGLVFWVKANSLSLNDADPVGTWTDSSASGYNVTQATASKKPLYKTSIINGQPVVRFDGTDDFLNLTSANPLPNPTVGYTLFSVGSNAEVANNQSFICIANAGGAERKAMVQVSTSVKFIYAGNDQSSYGQKSFTATTVKLDTIVYDGSLTGSANRLKWYDNQVQQTFDSFPGTAIPASLTGATTGIEVGGTADAARTVDGDIAEILIYNTALSGANIATVEAYLKTKYGI